MVWHGWWMRWVGGPGAERKGQLELTWWASLPMDLCFGRYYIQTATLLPVEYSFLCFSKNYSVLFFSFWKTYTSFSTISLSAMSVYNISQPSLTMSGGGVRVTDSLAGVVWCVLNALKHKTTMILSKKVHGIRSSSSTRLAERQRETGGFRAYVSGEKTGHGGVSCDITILHCIVFVFWLSGCPTIASFFYF